MGGQHCFRKHRSHPLYTHPLSPTPGYWHEAEYHIHGNGRKNSRENESWILHVPPAPIYLRPPLTRIRPHLPNQEDTPEKDFLETEVVSVRDLHILQDRVVWNT